MINENGVDYTRSTCSEKLYMRWGELADVARCAYLFLSMLIRDRDGQRW